MNRHYYVSNDLDDLERLEQELEASGIATEQIHVVSERDAEVRRHELHAVPSFLKQDVVRTGRRGLMIGLALAAITLLLAYLSDWAQGPAGWVPFLFLAIVLLGFSVWEGSLVGLSNPNLAFRPFADRLRRGDHLFFVDVDTRQERILAHAVSHHPGLQDAGTGRATPDWAMGLQQRLQRLRRMI